METTTYCGLPVEDRRLADKIDKLTDEIKNLKAEKK